MGHHGPQERVELPSNSVEQLKQDIESLFYELERETDSIDLLWKITSKKNKIIDLLNSTSKEQHLTLQQITELEGTLQSLHQYLTSSEYMDDHTGDEIVSNEKVGIFYEEIQRTHEKINQIQTTQHDHEQLLTSLREQLNEENERFHHLLQLIEEIKQDESGQEWKQVLLNVKYRLEALENGYERQTGDWSANVDGLKKLIEELIQSKQQELKENNRWRSEVKESQKHQDETVSQLEGAIEQLDEKLQSNLSHLLATGDLEIVQAELQSLRELVELQPTMEQLESYTTTYQIDVKELKELIQNRMDDRGVHDSLEKIVQTVNQMKRNQDNVDHEQVLSLLKRYSSEMMTMKSSLNDLQENILSLELLKKEDLNNDLSHTNREEEIQEYFAKLENVMEREREAERGRMNRIEAHLSQLQSDFKAVLQENSTRNADLNTKLGDVFDAIQDWKQEQQSNDERSENNQEVLHSLHAIVEQVHQLVIKVETLEAKQNENKDKDIPIAELINDMEKRLIGVIEKQVQDKAPHVESPQYMFSLIDRLMKKVETLEEKLQSEQTKHSFHEAKSELVDRDLNEGVGQSVRKKEEEKEPETDEGTKAQHSTPFVSADNWFYHSAKNAKETQQLNPNKPKQPTRPKSPTYRSSNFHQTKRRPNIESKPMQEKQDHVYPSTSPNNIDRGEVLPKEEKEMNQENSKVQKPTQKELPKNDSEVPKNQESSLHEKSKDSSSFIENVKNFFKE